MVDLFGYQPVQDWLDGKEPPVSSEDLEALTNPDSPHFDEEAHRRKWNPDTWGMDVATQSAMRLNEAQFGPGQMPVFSATGPVEGVT